MSDVLHRLKLLANLPSGATLPPELYRMGGINNWGIIISSLCLEAAQEIEALRGRLGCLSEDAKVALREEYDEVMIAQNIMEKQGNL